MVRHLPIGYDQALQMTLEALKPLEAQPVSLADAVDRVAADDLTALVNCPSVDASLKDGYAVACRDIQGAALDMPVELCVDGLASAGNNNSASVSPGTAVRILTGAKIPGGADAVLSDEYVELRQNAILAKKGAERGRNILPMGSDVTLGQKIITRGQRLSPGRVGLLAAAGYSQVSVIRNPDVTIVATGDEVLAPGQPMTEGKLYASNLVTLNAWCRRFGMAASTELVKDDADQLYQVLDRAVKQSDAVITSGGAWTGDRDMIVRVLDRLGWRQLFHRIRIGPGKAVGFGLLGNKPVFILPGGPPSNLIAFLQIALPGLLTLAGLKRPGLPTVSAHLAEGVNGRFADWTQFIFGRLENGEGQAVFHPLRQTSRLQSMASAQAVVSIPEGLTRINGGDVITAQLLV